MRKKPGTKQSHGEKVVKDIRRATRKQYSAEEKIRIVLDGLKGEDSIAELCRREGIAWPVGHAGACAPAVFFEKASKKGAANVRAKNETPKILRSCFGEGIGYS